MGSGQGDEDERPVHDVPVAAFYMDCWEVTQKAYESLAKANPSGFKGPDRPVERLSWQAAAKYCNLRSQAEGLAACYDPKTLQCTFDADGYRLPTEAEWEYACRAESATEYPFGDDAAELAGFAWFKANAGGATHPVGQKKPNAWGLYDMQGNVAEWCNDFYAADAYAAGDSVRGRGPVSGDYRVLRGGSWRTPEGRCRSAARQGESPGASDACLGYEAYGFRCVRRANGS